MWAGPGSSVSDFTQNAKSTKTQIIGQVSIIVVAHVLFAIASVFIIIGGSIYLGHQEWNILTIINEWSNFWAILISTGTINDNHFYECDEQYYTCCISIKCVIT